MWILSRKEGEQIVVPECQLTLTVLDIQGQRIRLGISAPPDIHVYGRENSHPIDPSKICREAVTTSVSEDPSMPVRVLIADPDEYLVSDYCDYLEQHGFEVATATTALECVEKLREFAPNVLILEPSIPWGWGDGVLAMMHEESDIPSVPVLVLTYGRDRGVLYRLAPYKIDDYQVKPMRPRRLAERIRAIAPRPTFTASPVHESQSLASQQIAIHK